MSITGPSSFPPTIAIFLEHWEEVNTARGAEGPMLVAGGSARADLDTLAGSLDAARDGVTDAVVERALARNQLTAQVTVMQVRVVEFNTRVRADLAGSIFARALPSAFPVNVGEGTVRDALRQMTKLWTKINALSPAPSGLVLPLALQGAYTLALFEADREGLRTAYRDLSDREVELRLARGERDALQTRIYEMLKNYRLKVPVSLPANHPLIATLPALSVPQGRTPAAVKAQVVWDNPTGKAKVTWDASEDADLKHYEVRADPGDSYQSDDETVLATVLPGAPRELLTDFSLVGSGLVVGFKVYVVLNSGHEKGSGAVYVTSLG